MKLHSYTVDIYDPEVSKYPIVRHEFMGKTKDEAQKRYEEHLETDTMLRCVVKEKSFCGKAYRSDSYWGRT